MSKKQLSWSRRHGIAIVTSVLIALTLLQLVR